MDNRILNFRNTCAEEGLELTPLEAEGLVVSYVSIKEEIEAQVAVVPNFYKELCNRTTEQKLEDIKQLKKDGCPMSLKEYNQWNSVIKKICEIEGYDNQEI